MATVNLGAIKFNWKGAYNNSTQYQVDDVVSSGGSSYICILASQGNAVSNGTYWSLMAQAGTDGTNVATTLTTQGDLLYRDGSGLQRLAAGTSGQVLQTGGSGANPSWTNLSSDYVFLGSGSGTNASSISVDFFSATYDLYKVFVSGWYGSNAGYSTRMRLNSSAGTAASNSVYRFAFTGGYYNNSNNGSATQSTSGWDQAYFNISNISTNAYEFADHEFTIIRPHSSSTKTSVIATGGGFEVNHIYSRQGHGIFNTDMQHTGVTFYASTGTVTIPYIKVFGIKTS